MTCSEHHASANSSYLPSIEESDGTLAVLVAAPVTPLLSASEPNIAWETAATAYLNAALDSPNTRRAYERHLRDAGVVLGGIPLDSLSGTELASYRSSVLASHLAPSSQAQALAAVRSFLLWIGDMGAHHLSMRVIRVALKAPTVSTASRYPVVSDPEARAMFAAAETSRDRALLAVMLGAGLRVAEVAHLRIADISSDMDGASALFVHQGKGRKDRVVPIQDDVVGLLREYLVETKRFLSSDGPLFLANDRGAGGRSAPGLSTRAISRTVRSLAAKAGVSAKKVTPHALRHSFAMRCLRAGMSVVAVSKLLGHSSIATTQRYVDHLAIDELRGSMPSLPIE